MLRVRDLHVYYGSIHAVQGISLDVAEGELVAIIGANGAGKSATLKTISGLLRPASGTIEFAKKRIDKLPPHAIVRLGLIQVPEGRQLFPEMTVLENLGLGAAYQPKGPKTINENLEEVFNYFPILSERRRQKAGTLSGGEQQMLALGRALMASPRLLLLDEPSLGLAPVLVESLFQIIGTVRERGVTTLLVEQNAVMALQLADRAYVMETGKIVASGDASELRESEIVKKAYLGM